VSAENNAFMASNQYTYDMNTELPEQTSVDGLTINGHQMARIVAPIDGETQDVYWACTRCEIFNLVQDTSLRKEYVFGKALSTECDRSTKLDY